MRTFSKDQLKPLGTRAKVEFINEGKGFGLVALERIPKGTIIIENERPLAATLNPGVLGRCAYCWKKKCQEAFQCICGVQYCSLVCRDTDDPVHRLMCTGCVDSENHPLVLFKLEALHTNPLFLTAARMVSISLANPTQFASSISNLVCPRWDEAVACPKDEPNPNGFRQEFKDLSSRMSEILEMAILLPNEPMAVNRACTYFSNYLGCLEHNQFEIQIDDDEEEEDEEDQEMGNQGDEEDDRPVVSSKRKREQEEDESDEPCGAGIFTLCCQVNHDCDPNSEICFPSGTNEACLYALRDIEPGEEICVSYIDEEMDLLERREDLEDYGFECQCKRCVTEEQWMNIQTQLATQVISDRRDCTYPVTKVGGFDISFPEDPNDPSVACLVVLSFPDMKLLYQRLLDVTLDEPYIPGFLAFREAPVCAKMLAEIEDESLRPDVMLLDGCGVLHPRRCGLASHIGVVCNIPTIGVSKKVLAVDGLERDRVKKLVRRALEKGSRQIDLIGDSGTLWGRALVSPKAKNAVYVSVGHRLDLDTATEIVKVACEKSRVPEPIRRADLTSREELRKRQQSTKSINVT